MKKTLLLFSLIISVPFFLLSQPIDQENSVVNFTINGIMGIDVEGTFKGMQGEITFYPDELSQAQFNVCVNANTIKTGINKRDKELKGPDFFDVENHPRICFQSKQTVKTESGYLVTGYLTIRGITKEVEIPFIFDSGTFKGELVIERLAFNLGEDYGSFTIGKKAFVEVICDLKN